MRMSTNNDDNNSDNNSEITNIRNNGLWYLKKYG